MAQARIFPLADRVLGGQLEQRLRTKRSAGVSFDAIARELAGEGIRVSGETVRMWCQELNIGATQEVAS